MAKKQSMDSEAQSEVQLTLRGILSVLIERERRSGVTMDELAAMLARAGIAHADAAKLLGTTPDGARVAAGRGKAKLGRGGATSKRGGSRAK